MRRVFLGADSTLRFGYLESLAPAIRPALVSSGLGRAISSRSPNGKARLCPARDGALYVMRRSWSGNSRAEADIMRSS